MMEFNSAQMAEICMQPGDLPSPRLNTLIAAAYENGKMFDRGLAYETPERANQGTD